MTTRVPDEPGGDAATDAVGTEARADLEPLHDLERHRQRAGLERQRQVLRLDDGLAAAHGDLSVPVDPALDDRRRALDPAVQHDGHVVADVRLGGRAELAAAGAVELEEHDRPVRQLVELGGGVHQVPAGDDRLLLDDIEEAVRLHPDADRGGRPEDLDAARKRPRDLGNPEHAVHPGVGRLRDEVFAGNPAPRRGAGLDQAAQYAALHRCRVGAGGRRVAAEERLHRASARSCRRRR